MDLFQLQKKLVNIGAFILLLVLFYNSINNYYNSQSIPVNRSQNLYQATIDPKKKYEDYTLFEKILYKIAEYKQPKTQIKIQTVQPQIGDKILVQCKSINYNFDWCRWNYILKLNENYEDPVLPKIMVQEISKLNLDKETRFGIVSSSLLKDKESISDVLFFDIKITRVLNE